jgi:hypothetical protein
VDIYESFGQTMPVPEAIFKPVVPGEAVVTLVLIENSQAMVHSWSDLRDHHLPTLLGTMKLANPIVPVRLHVVDPPNIIILIIFKDPGSMVNYLTCGR